MTTAQTVIKAFAALGFITAFFGACIAAHAVADRARERRERRNAKLYHVDWFIG